jgi:hypothetical protein
MSLTSIRNRFGSRKGAKSPRLRGDDDARSGYVVLRAYSHELTQPSRSLYKSDVSMGLILFGANSDRLTELRRLRRGNLMLNGDLRSCT